MRINNAVEKNMAKYLELSKKIENYLGIVGNPVEIFALYEASKHIPLQFNNKRNIAGYDAIDEKGHKVEIKGARIKNKDFGYCKVFKNWKAKLGKFDYAILVSFDYDLDVKFVLKISEDLIRKHFKKQSNSIIVSQDLVKEELHKKSQFKFLSIATDIDIYEIIKSRGRIN